MQCPEPIPIVYIIPGQAPLEELDSVRQDFAPPVSPYTSRAASRPSDNLWFACSSYDEYGFQRGADFDAASHQEFMSSYLPVLVRRGQRWETAYTAGEEKNVRLKRFIRKGIPNR